jgi:hypothetical protein
MTQDPVRNAHSFGNIEFSQWELSIVSVSCAEMYNGAMNWRDIQYLTIMIEFDHKFDVCKRPLHSA